MSLKVFEHSGHTASRPAGSCWAVGLDGECILNESSELSKRGDFEPRLEPVLFIESRRGGWYGNDGWLLPAVNGDKRPVVFFREVVGEGGFEDGRGEIGDR